MKLAAAATVAAALVAAVIVVGYEYGAIGGPIHYP